MSINDKIKMETSKLELVCKKLSDEIATLKNQVKDNVQILKKNGIYTVDEKTELMLDDMIKKEKELEAFEIELRVWRKVMNICNEK